MDHMPQKFSNTKWVTEAALIGRINERLAEDSRALKEIRMEDSPSVGNLYDQSDGVADENGSIDIEAIGRRLGVLAPDESVARDTDRRSENDLKKQLMID